MKINEYRGYQLHLGEEVDIYFQGERIETVPTLAIPEFSTASPTPRTPALPSREAQRPSR